VMASVPLLPSGIACAAAFTSKGGAN